MREGGYSPQATETKILLARAVHVGMMLAGCAKLMVQDGSEHHAPSAVVGVADEPTVC